MRQLSSQDLARIREHGEAPCISLYQPTHRHFPDSQQDPIRYRNLCGRVEGSLKQQYSTREVRELLDKYETLQRDNTFWNHRTEGLAILGSPHTFDVFELQRPVRELAIVAQNFYTKPLLRILQSADRYQVLCLGRRECMLYERNRVALDPVDLSDVLAPVTEAVREGRTDAGVVVRSSPGGTALYYGMGEKSDWSATEQEHFFRAVDRAVLDHHSRPSSVPLLLAALPEYHGPFRALSRNPFLLSAGIYTNPEALEIDELRAQAWQAIAPTHQQRVDRLVAEYETAKARQQATDDLQEATVATLAGRIGTLLVEADRQIAGKIDETTHRIEPGEPSDPEVGDVLNDLAEIVARMDGAVVVLPAERMPASTGLAATYRF